MSVVAQMYILLSVYSPRLCIQLCIYYVDY